MSIQILHMGFVNDFFAMIFLINCIIFVDYFCHHSTNRCTYSTSPHVQNFYHEMFNSILIKNLRYPSWCRFCQLAYMLKFLILILLSEFITAQFKLQMQVEFLIFLQHHICFIFVKFNANLIQQNKFKHQFTWTSCVLR